MPPAPVDRVHKGGTGQRVRSIAESFDAVLDGDGEMLVAAKVDGLHTPQGTQGFIATLLRPTVAIEVSQKTAILTAMHVDGPTESRGGQDGLMTHAHPILGPRGEELQLAIAEKLQAG